jgi:branched-chain amino acid transport system substrate-binding protein
MLEVRLSSIIAAGLAGALASGIALAAPGPQAGKTVKIGVIADVSGSAGAYGTTQKNAFDLAAEDLASGKIDAGGATLQFDVQDGASDPAQVVTLTQKFTTDGTALLIGPTLSSEAKKADPIAVKAGLPILAISNTAQGITAQGPCVFRDSLAEEQVVPEAIAKIVKSLKPKTAAIIYGDDNQFSKTDFEIFKDVLAKNHIELVDVETYHTGDADFKAQLTKIADKKPDLLVVGSLLAEAVKILAQVKQTGITAHIVGGNGLNSPKLMELAGPAAENVIVGAAYFLGNSFTGNAAFVERYTKKFGTGPDQFAAQAYAAAQVAALAVKSGATTPDAFCSTLKKLPVIQTVLGPIAFEPTRDVRAASAILQVKNGKFAYFH